MTLPRDRRPKLPVLDRPPMRVTPAPRSRGRIEIRAYAIVFVVAFVGALMGAVTGNRLVDPDGDGASDVVQPDPASSESSTGTPAAPAAAAATVPTAIQCLARSTTASPAGEVTQEYRPEEIPDDHTFDLRATRFLALMDKTQPRESWNNYPVYLGANQPRGLCVIGGSVVGNQSRSLTWQQIKHEGSETSSENDGDAFRLDGTGWYLLDGARAENVIDAVRVGGDGMVIRNMYATHIRDDCVENDRLSDAVVYDSLFDGCFMGISERPGKGTELEGSVADLTKRLTLDHVMLRLDARMAGGHAGFFKWSESSNRLVLKDTVLMAETLPSQSESALDFPVGTVVDNVVIVWLGSGDYPGRLVPGVTVTKDRSVWDDAKNDWLTRHGCTSVDACDPTVLIDPDPPSH